jgi:hypothetical protein
LNRAEAFMTHIEQYAADLHQEAFTEIILETRVFRRTCGQHNCLIGQLAA